MGTLKSLARRMNKEADKLDGRASEAAKKVALIIISSLAYETPVDVSTAISNWQVGLGSPVPLKRAAFYPGRKGSTYRSSAQTTIADAREILTAKTPGQTIYISNLLPYIRRLNAGYSKQHPGAFVETAVLQGREYLRNQRRERS